MNDVHQRLDQQDEKIEAIHSTVKEVKNAVIDLKAVVQTANEVSKIRTEATNKQTYSFEKIAENITKGIRQQAYVNVFIVCLFLIFILIFIGRIDGNKALDKVTNLKISEGN